MTALNIIEVRRLFVRSRSRHAPQLATSGGLVKLSMSSDLRPRHLAANYFNQLVSIRRHFHLTPEIEPPQPRLTSADSSGRLLIRPVLVATGRAAILRLVPLAVG